MPHNDGITEYQHHILWIVILLLSGECNYVLEPHPGFDSRLALATWLTQRRFSVFLCKVNFFKVEKRTQLKDPVPSLAIHKATRGNIGPGHPWK